MLNKVEIVRRVAHFGLAAANEISQVPYHVFPSISRGAV